MTRTQLETIMATLPKMARVDEETLTMLVAKEAYSDKEDKIKLKGILTSLLTAAKSRGMTLHALKDKASGAKRMTFDANMYEILKVLTSGRAITAKIIICIGKVNDLLKNS